MPTRRTEPSRRPRLGDERTAAFAPATFDFLRELAARQDREWFRERKSTYERDVREPMARTVTALAGELAARGLPFLAEPERAIFRVHRDTRFSPDKRPFKTHVSAALTRDGIKMSPGVLYVHVDPEGSFVATGFYAPERDALLAIRTAIASRPAGFRTMLAALAKAGIALDGDGEALVRAPRGFEHVTDPAIVAVLKHKSFTASRELTEAEVTSAELPATIADFAAASAPLLRYGWKAIDAR